AGGVYAATQSRSTWNGWQPASVGVHDVPWLRLKDARKPSRPQVLEPRSAHTTSLLPAAPVGVSAAGLGHEEVAIATSPPSLPDESVAPRAWKLMPSLVLTVLVPPFDAPCQVMYVLPVWSTAVTGSFCPVALPSAVSARTSGVKPIPGGAGTGADGAAATRGAQTVSAI